MNKNPATNSVAFSLSKVMKKKKLFKVKWKTPKEDKGIIHLVRTQNFSEKLTFLTP